MLPDNFVVTCVIIQTYGPLLMTTLCGEEQASSKLFRTLGLSRTLREDSGIRLTPFQYVCYYF